MIDKLIETLPEREREDTLWYLLCNMSYFSTGNFHTGEKKNEISLLTCQSMINIKFLF